MNRPPGASKMLELLENLRANVRDFTARAEKLSGDLKTKLARERQRRKLATEELTAQSASESAAADAGWQTALQAAQKNYEARKTRINKAYRTSKELALSRIENLTGQKKYGLQKQVLQAERDREENLASNTAAFEELQRNLAAEGETLAALETTGRRAFKGHRKFLRLLAREYARSKPDDSRDEQALLPELRGLLGETREHLDHIQRIFLLRLFRHLSVWVLLFLALFALVPLRERIGADWLSYRLAAEVAGAGLAAVLVLRYLVELATRPLAASISSALAKARALHDGCLATSQTRHQQELDRIHREFEQTTQRADQELKRTHAEATQKRMASRGGVDEKTIRIAEKHEQLHKQRLQRIEAQHAETLARLKQEAAAKEAELARSGEELEKKLEGAFRAQWQALEMEWRNIMQPIYKDISSAQTVASELFPTWDSPVWTGWTAPGQFAHAAQFAQLKVDVQKLCETPPKGPLLALPGPPSFSLPLCLIFPEEGSVLFETAAAGRDQAIGALNNLILRLLSVAPPGRLNFSIIDPVGLGQNFAGVMHLADYEEQLINSRIWTQSSQIEQRLGALNEHIEKVIQMYLRNEYRTIAEYNEQAGVIAEKYHFLVVADFPANFTDTAARRLLSIAASGPRCGVYILLHWDTRQPLPQDFVPDELRKNSVCISGKAIEFIIAGKPLPGADLALLAPPSPEQAIAFVQTVGKASRDSSRVEVPFAHVAPKDEQMWSEETTSELRVPIGRTGATKLQYLAIGKGTCQHGLVAGKTGSGKSTLFHVIITNLAMWCSPEQVEFYLVDFKKGVEFKCYATRRLPHARVVAIESDREFGLSVLQRVDDELRRRGDLFRKLGVQDLPGYKRAGGTETIPRSLLLIDEFQEFFVEDDKIAQTASLLLDRIVRQGRAFGIHVLLGSQTLGGAYTVARTTLGQMVIRIALQCNEADAYLIMDDTNPAPRLLSRPGEGIYNDTAGTIEGNSPFQVVWLPDEERDASLAKVRRRADQNGSAYPGPIVFEGNAPADVRENLLLQQLLEAESVQAATAGRLWLGAPNSIKGPTEVVFHRQSGNNLVIVGQREEATLAMFSVGLIALAAQFRPGAARFILCDISPPGSPPREFLERIVQAIPHPITLAKQTDLGGILNGLVAEMKQRTDDESTLSSSPAFLFIHGLQRFNKLRFEEDFGFSASDAEAAPNPGALLNTLVCEGTRLGFHVIASCDSYNNVSRFLSRKALSEFEMRVLFQMSPNDSASLIDNPKAASLGLHRALFYNQQEGHLETFRPYALPGGEWLEYAARNLARLLNNRPGPS